MDVLYQIILNGRLLVIYEIKFLKKKTFFDLPIDKREKKMYNIKLHYNRLICLKMGRDCFGTAVFILILYEKIYFAAKFDKISKRCKKAKNT